MLELYMIWVKFSPIFAIFLSVTCTLNCYVMMEPIYLICLHSLTVNDIKVTHFCKLPNQNQ